MVTYINKRFKTALNRFKFIDSWFWNRYSLNAYNGCQIGCVYCDARSSRYYLPIHFDTEIMVKQDLAMVLDNQIRSSKALPDVVAMSGTSDPYQAAEARFFNTQTCLKVLKKYSYPVKIISKSNLIRRDYELINQIGKQTWASVSFTITTMDKILSKFLEQGAAFPEQRIESINIIKKNYAHIQTGITLMPIIPYLTDNEENLEAIFQAAYEVGADYIIMSPGMTMNDVQGSWFLNKLETRYPELLEKYRDVYNFTSSSNYDGREVPCTSYFEELMPRVQKIVKKFSIPLRMQRYLPNDFRYNNYILAEKLLTESYDQLLFGKRNNQLHWAAMHIQNLDRDIMDYYDSDALSEIQGVKEISSRIKKDIREINLQKQSPSLNEWF
ncbi:MAG: hypothetical protein INQ03_18090 [Candidatus Heimdallarchaeota archaeon]|nr:hypothetical protein [Candidatus Heimdallarchaeota archaeon]